MTRDDRLRSFEAMDELRAHSVAHRGSVNLAYQDGWCQELPPHYYPDRKFMNHLNAERESQNLNWSEYCI